MWGLKYKNTPTHLCKHTDIHTNMLHATCIPTHKDTHHTKRESLWHLPIDSHSLCLNIFSSILPQGLLGCYDSTFPVICVCVCVRVCVCVCVVFGLTDSPLLCPKSDSADSSVMSLITVCVCVCVCECVCVCLYCRLVYLCIVYPCLYVFKSVC